MPQNALGHLPRNGGVLSQCLHLKEFLMRSPIAVGRIGLCWGSPLWALLVFGATALPGETPALVIRGGSVFDSVSGTMQPDRTIVIEEGRIKAIGSPDRPVTLPQGAQ